MIARWRERLCKKIAANKWRIDEKKLAAESPLAIMHDAKTEYDPGAGISLQKVPFFPPAGTYFVQASCRGGGTVGRRHGTYRQ